MENRIMNDDLWVQKRLRELETNADWNPNAAFAFARLKRRQLQRRTWRRRWIWSVAAAMCAAVMIMALPAPATCALLGAGCERPLEVPEMPAIRLPAVPATPVSPKSASPAKLLRAKPVLSFKEAGSPDAPVVCEIYSDYECPACAGFYSATYPQFVAEYVRTGRVRVIHRDFPLPQHKFARLAAQYANAAGELGHYDDVVRQLFTHQSEWANGDIDAVIARVLPAEVMRNVRALVTSGAKQDALIADDLAMVARDQISQTPTIVFVSQGVRRKVEGAPSLPLLRSYLSQILPK